MDVKTLSLSSQKIAIQGIKGAFHELAARKFFGDQIELVECYSFPELFDSLDHERANIGVVAIENTLAGTILPNYALLRNSSYKIAGEVYLRIEHHLLALDGVGIEEIREVYSHPMAIEQCREFFKPFPQIRLIESEDTAASARMVVERGQRKKAAIGSQLAAQHYGLSIVQNNIETNPLNYTRFWIILHENDLTDHGKNVDKASLSFVVKHEAGSLAQVLLLLAGHGLNLSKIQSLPLVGQAWKYIIHVDLEFDDYDQYQRAMAAINFQVDGLKVLGEYMRGSK